MTQQEQGALDAPRLRGLYSLFIGATNDQFTICDHLQQLGALHAELSSDTLNLSISPFRFGVRAEVERLRRCLFGVGFLHLVHTEDSSKKTLVGQLNKREITKFYLDFLDRSRIILDRTDE